MKHPAPISRLDAATRIRNAVYAALPNRKLFQSEPIRPGFLWLSQHFHVAAIMTPVIASFEVWPIKNGRGLSGHPETEAKVLNLHLDSYGKYELVTFRRGPWEKELLGYVGAPLGLLTLRACESSPKANVGIGK